MNDRLLGIVLCGGKSSRMGRDKASLPWGEQTWLTHAIERLRSICDQVAVSGDAKTKHDAILIPDPIAHRGPVVGLVQSLRYADNLGLPACLVTPVDTPWITGEDLGRLRQRWVAERQLTIAVQRSTTATDDRIEPLVGVYPVDLLAELEKLAASADRSLYRWIEAQEFTALPLPTERLKNINTPEDDTSNGS